LILPFSLWWYPRRYKVLGGPRGLELTSSFWAIGILAFGSCAIIAATFGALVIRLALPASYLPAIALLPPLLSIALLQETASLSNGATYARASGWHVLTINLGGALIAVSLYVLLIPTLGVNGAIIATLAGQGFRLAAFLMAKHEGQSVPLPIVRGGIFLAACIVVVTQICQIGPANLMTLLGSLASVLVAAAFLLLYSWQRHNQVVAA
jgi:O-antigen/teichoic acid export membrane protein